jgi:putative ubiquitin-RnfH superfamily antitoxin RatB of RatAB toxin-antitoxin module
MPSWCGRKRSTVRSLSVLRIEIVYAQPQCSLVKSLNLPAGATIADALSLVASDQDFLGLDLASCAVGIFGKVARKDQQLMDGDRIEIYRPLVEEPKLARRRRVGKSSRR